MVLQTRWGYRGASLVGLGGYWGAAGVILQAFGGILKCHNLFLGSLEAPAWGPRNPEQPSGRRQNEADGLPQPPRGLGRRLPLYFLDMLVGNMMRPKRRRRREPSRTS